jgi:hypothetical protein
MSQGIEAAEFEIDRLRSSLKSANAACAEKDAEIAQWRTLANVEKGNAKAAEARATAAEAAFANGQKNEHATAARLSELLSDGGASTWDEIMHAAEQLKERATEAETQRDLLQEMLNEEIGAKNRAEAKLAAAEQHRREWMEQASDAESAKDQALRRAREAERREAEKDKALKAAFSELWRTYYDTPRLRPLFDQITTALASPSTPSPKE